METYFLAILMCTAHAVHSNEVNHSIEETDNATHIYTRLKNYMQSNTDATFGDNLRSDSGPKIHNLYVIMPNDTTTQDSNYDQTFILSKNVINSTTNADSTLNINDNLRFKVTEIIDVEKIIKGTPGMIIPSSKLDMERIQDNLQKSFSQKNSTKSDKLRSIIIRRRKINNKKLLMESQTEGEDKNEETIDAMNHTNLLTENTSRVNSDNLLFNNATSIGKQIDDLEMIPFTFEDAMLPAESTMQEYHATPEVTNIHPSNHATVYKPIVKHTIDYKKVNKEGLSQSLNNTTNILNVTMKNSKVFYNQPYNVLDNKITLPANSLMQFISKMFEPMIHSGLPMMKGNSNLAKLPSSERLLIVGPIPKPLATHLVYEPYKSQFVLPNV